MVIGYWPYLFLALIMARTFSGLSIFPGCAVYGRRFFPATLPNDLHRPIQMVPDRFLGRPYFSFLDGF
jgi:hypothetical protein